MGGIKNGRSETMKQKFSGKNLSICAVALAGALGLSLPAAADAQMAAPLKFSPPLVRILSVDPTYQEMLKQFRGLVTSPEKEELRPPDFETMALLAFQAVAENAATTPEALETIVLMHEACPGANQRRMISNAAKDILRFRPQHFPAVEEALATMRDREQDAGVRSYIESALQSIMQKYSPPPAP